MGPSTSDDRAVREAVALLAPTGRGEVFWLDPTGMLRWARWPDDGGGLRTLRARPAVTCFSATGSARRAHLVCATVEGEVCCGQLQGDAWAWFPLLSLSATHDRIARLILLPAPGGDLLALVLARLRTTQRWELLTCRLSGEPADGAMALRRTGAVRLPAPPRGPAPLQALYRAWVPPVAAAMGSDGTLHVLHVHPEGDGRMALHLLSRHGRGVKWQHRRMSVQGSAAHPCLTRDGSGVVWAAWKEGDGEGFRYVVMPLTRESPVPPLTVAAGEATDRPPALAALGDGVGFLCHDGARWRLYRVTTRHGSPAVSAHEVALPAEAEAAGSLWLAASPDGCPFLLHLPQDVPDGVAPVLLRVADGAPGEEPEAAEHNAGSYRPAAWPHRCKRQRRFRRPVSARRVRMPGRWAALALAVWVAAGLAGSEPVGRPLAPPYVVQAVPVSEVVELRGTAVPPRTIVVRAPRAGRIDQVWARPGARVAAGEALVTYADPGVEAERRRLVYRRELLRLERDAFAAAKEWTLHAPVRGQVAEAPIVPGDPVHSGQVLVRLRDAAGRTTVGLTAARDGVVRQLHVAVNERVARGAPLVTVEHPPTVLAWKKASLALEQVERELEALARRAREKTITAPQAGTVIEVNITPGAVVAANEPVVRLREGDVVRVIVSLDGRWVAPVRPGHPVRVWPEGEAKEPLVGTVREIRPQPGSDRVFLVTDVPVPPAEPDPVTGAVTVRLVVPRCSACLAVPVSYLHGTDAQPYVHLRLPGGEVIRQRVTVGVRGGGLVEIRHGVVPGDVLLP